MLIFDDRRFARTPFESESDLEHAVVDNYEHIFGPSSIYLTKSKIETSGGEGTIPDGFAIDLSANEWYIVEAELSHHSTWEHIIPQVTKQIQASDTENTKKTVKDLAVESYSENDVTKEKFRETGIEEINIRKFLNNLLDKKPTVGIPIDGIPSDLENWTETIKYDVKLWVIEKFAEIGDASNIIYSFPENSRPDIDTERDNTDEKDSIDKTDVSMEDLIESDLLEEGENLSMEYKPRGGDRRHYEASVLDDGSLELLGQKFSSPSSAAVAAIQDAGSDRETENGWRVWKNSDENTLDDLREEHIKLKSRRTSANK